MLLSPPQTTRLFVFSTIGSPALIVSSLNRSIDVSPLLKAISCSQNISNMSSALVRKIQPRFSMAVTLPALAEFVDDGSGAYPGKMAEPLRRNNPLWAAPSWDQSSVTFNSADGVVQLSVVCHSTGGRDTYNPYLAFNDESCSVDLVINGFNYSRFVREVVPKLPATPARLRR